MTHSSEKKRELWLDALRILSAFLVIVNHTNSDVFQSANPTQPVWWASIVWYVLCKAAVPVFVMISGACLLGRQDSLRKCFARFGRIVGALLLFSYLYFLHDAWVNYGLWPRMFQLDVFFHKVWTMQIADSFWYLYFYAGLMLALPFLQRMVLALKQRELAWLSGLCILFGMIWPMLSVLFPALALPKYLDLSLFSGMTGLLLLGWQIRRLPAHSHTRMAAILFVLSVLASVLCLRLQYQADEKYWVFMDSRLQPSPFVAASAVSLMILFRSWFSRPLSARSQRVWMELGGCAFGVYLLQQWVIAQTEFRLFAPLCQALPVFPALLVWELAVFLLCLMAALVMRRIPLLKKLV